ncbi:hypothetical protein KEM52_001470 [Ascosphaera acerosa]|nr:hypothetical protein KEM52_001470 [Ascosphaera acerosa]
MAPFALPFNPNLSAFSATLGVLRTNPAMLVPHTTIPTFLHLPEDLGAHLQRAYKPGAGDQGEDGHGKPDIRVLVIDKDNTLTTPESTRLPPAYLAKLAALRESRTSPFNMHANPHGVLLVSNTVGAAERYEAGAREMERALAHLRIPVFRAARGTTITTTDETPSATKKPLNHAAVVAYLRAKGAIDSPAQIAVVGDRLATDVLMASMAGAWSVWVRDGVPVAEDGRGSADHRGLFARMEAVLLREMQRRGVAPVCPKGWQPRGG